MQFLGAAKLVWLHRDKALGGVVVVLIATITLLNGQVDSLELALAAKPRVETRIETRIKTVIQTRIVQGPERVVEKITEKPNGDRIIERTIVRDKIVTVSGTNTTEDREEESDEDPVIARRLLDAKTPRWIVGASIAPLELAVSSYQSNRLKALQTIRVGHSIGSRIDLTYGYRLHGPWESRHLAEISFRF